MTVHGLRHVAAGLMVSQGASVLAVSRQLAHADPSETLNRYAALFRFGFGCCGGVDECGADWNVVELSWGVAKSTYFCRSEGIVW